MAATRTKGDRVDVTDKDLVGAYLDRIGRTPLLDAQEEVDLAKAIEGGLYAEQLLEEGRTPAGASREELEDLVAAGLRAKQRFVEANLRLVVSIARKYPTDSLPLIDLIQEGNLGLMRAVEKFDYRRGFKFSTYATWWIRQAIGRGLSHTARTIRLPVHVEEELSRLRRAERQLGRELGREPTREELAGSLGAEPEHVDELLRWRRDPASLDATVDDAGETPMGDLLEDPEAVTPEAEILALDDLEGLGRLLDRLPERESAILRARFGMDNGQPLSYAQIGARYGLSHNRVRQITDRSLRRLRQLATETDLSGRRALAGAPHAPHAAEERVRAGAGSRAA
ncbi:sigma-70 family RNA polymerase sigma factor [Actinomadura montaniterrae]|uniref:Sigma-70 family RNA polymerase sigma factor n=1 Tax=Actinomadura montaniterrae TaxID=1803903 RepID=A0A6L3W4P6_9ACTN|nr:sigma-70 family RNA polymerase sigma factor [Actinomadura montaniterrae]KAB2387949.1 sigma-70 family RNA polymerase sigma factor [Actinomadura montaniterrae]